jgi:branched-chain amino acid transport system ATP-binding protein
VSALLALSGVNAAYGASHVLHDVSLDVRHGEVVVLLGRNGAGKTTLMRTVMGLTRLLSGEILLDGLGIGGRAPHRIARAGIGLVPEDRRIFATLTVAENLELGRKPVPKGGVAWNLERVLEIFPTLGAMLDRKGGYLSGGQQQMLAIARTLLGNPGMLLLDEPGEGLAPVVVEQLAAQLARLRQEGVSMMISEQNLDFAAALGDRAYVLETGSVRHSATMAELRADTAWTRFVAF